MHPKKIYLLIINLLFVFNGFSQSNTIALPHKGNKGKFYFFWGYNRAYYTHSNLHLNGEHYDFTLYHLVAKDRQTPLSADVYLDPTKLTIPQCNYGLGYYFNDHYSISLSVDHMKYVMVQDQTVMISGYIKDSTTPYDGYYNHDYITVKEDLLVFEHTDGLNYFVAELNRTDNLLPMLTSYQGKKIEINLIEGVGIGGLYPRTNATLLSKNRHDAFHLAGYGASIKIGLDVTFYRHFYLAGHLKAGFIHMPDIRTTESSVDRGSQKFGFIQDNIMIGWRF